MSDAELVALAARGDRAAFGELVNRHQHAVYRAALAALRSPTEADDVVQEAFLSAYLRIGTFRGESSFKTWLLTIAWNKAKTRRHRLLDWLRRGLAGPAAQLIEGSPDIPDLFAMDLPSQEDALIDAELKAHLRRLIRQLPPKYRDPLMLAGTAEYSYDEIGQMLGIPTGTVKWRISEARHRLKRSLARLGYAAR